MSKDCFTVTAETLFIQTNARLQTLYSSMMHSLWMVMTTCDMSWAHRCEEDERAYQYELAAGDLRERVENFRLLGGDRLGSMEQRQLEVLSDEMLEFRASLTLQEKITSLWNELHYTISTFRAEVDGSPLSENEIHRLLTIVTDVEKRKRLWLASMKLGEIAAPKLVELVKLRNEAASQIGYANYYELKMAAQNIDTKIIDDIIREIRAALDEPYRAVKAEIDEEIAFNFRISRSAIRSWHYTHPFFQKHDRQNRIHLNWKKFQERLAEFFYPRGFDVPVLLQRADISAREGKSQANCCLHVDRSGDIRVSCNLSADLEGIGVFLHELGHAYYETKISAKLPFILRQPAHTCLSEAVALLFERLAFTPAWLRFMGLESAYIERAAELDRAFYRNLLIKLYWTIAFVKFERRLYENPDQPLNSLWWDIVEEVQGIQRPDEWDFPYWAAKAHFSTLPVYYHNYLLGEAAASQIESVLRDKFGHWHSEAAFANLSESFCSIGASKPWQSIIGEFCGDGLNTGALMKWARAMTHYNESTR